MNNTEKILQDMRKITMLTGQISSVHEESLKKWPYIIFDDVESVEIDYNLSKEITKSEKEGYIVFKVRGPIAPKDDDSKENIKKRCESLSRWARDMLWPEIKIEVYLNNSKCFLDSSTEDSVTCNFK